MTNVVITGGAGFLGARLARDLLAAGSLDVAGGGERPISQVTLLDQVAVPPDLAADPRVAQAAVLVREDTARFMPSPPPVSA